MILKVMLILTPFGRHSLYSNLLLLVYLPSINNFTSFIKHFSVKYKLLFSYLFLCQTGYCRFKNPYHNNLHAADVAQTGKFFYSLFFFVFFTLK